VLRAPSPGRVLRLDFAADATEELLSLSERQMRAYRWHEMSLVFQGAMNTFNPVRKVGDQIAEAMIRHGLMTRGQAR